jgi:hypothetical protein
MNDEAALAGGSDSDRRLKEYRLAEAHTLTLAVLQDAQARIVFIQESIADGMPAEAHAAALDLERDLAREVEELRDAA